mmetsp:Transcript_70633/g.196493  ORF Transcript_70633/g.196493 Transcript_70633/m.196493 type:complete len:324 (-) Transcript_70633:78-1049(-)
MPSSRTLAGAIVGFAAVIYFIWIHAADGKQWVTPQFVNRWNYSSPQPLPSSTMATTTLTSTTMTAPEPVYDLFIVIPVHANQKSRRDAMRKAWLNYPSSNHCTACQRHSIKIMFCLGNEGDLAVSLAEAKTEGDMFVMEDFGQNAFYTDMSMKTLRCISYAVKHFAFRFILKTDSDSFVFVDRLLDAFDHQALWSKTKMYAGNFRAGAGARASQNTKAKWYDPDYPAATGLQEYPKHAKGAGYILSVYLAQLLSKLSDDYFDMSSCEDVAIGAWLMPFKKDFVELDVHIGSSCEPPTLIDHYVEGEEMVRRWRAYTETGNPCS